MKKLIIILYFFPVKSFSQSQLAPIIGYQSKYGIHYNKHSGYVELKNGKKVTGIFQYALWEFPTYNLKMFTSDGKMIKRYSHTEIKNIVLAGSDSVLSRNDSTYFTVFDGSPYFYRQLSFDKDIHVYDWLFNVNERPGLLYRALLIKKDNEFFTCRSNEDFIKWMQKNAADKINWHKNITAQEVIRQLNGIL